MLPIFVITGRLVVATVGGAVLGAILTSRLRKTRKRDIDSDTSKNGNISNHKEFHNNHIIFYL
jgi:hypothetical protein